MSSYVMQDCQFEYLLSRINQETDSSEKKLHILYQSKGRLSGFQTTRILYAFGLTCDRLKALEIIENRMTSLSSCDAKSIIGTFSIPDDQLKALIVIKRHICDLSEICAKENILSCFIFPAHKQRAQEILHVSKLTSKDMISAGGHIIYSPFGSVLAQAPPLDPVLYSTIYMNSYSKPSQDKFRVEELGLETCCRPPAYLDPCCETEDQNCTAQPANCCVFCECPAKRPLYNHYPSGAAPLGLHNPTAKVGLDKESKCCEI